MPVELLPILFSQNTDFPRDSIRFLRDGYNYNYLAILADNSFSTDKNKLYTNFINGDSGKLKILKLIYHVIFQFKLFTQTENGGQCEEAKIATFFF